MFRFVSFIVVLALAGIVLGKEENKKMDKATFAGGCFWCMEAPFETLDGVISVTSGYTGGKEIEPSYEEVSSGRTGHYEAVEITFDSKTISYDKLLEVFWRQIDPTDSDGQFADRGPQYRTAIFYHDDQQRINATSSKEKLQHSKQFRAPIVTAIKKAGPFYKAESYHQNYYKRSPGHYKAYKKGSGRERFLKENWTERKMAPLNQFTKPNEAELKQTLTPLQYHVTQENGTEAPFQNAFWDNKKEGIYVDVVSFEPLFSSTDKYNSGTGWPSFSRPLVGTDIVTVTDKSHGMVRQEVRSRLGDSHLGHVFDDGPSPTGQRYCINSAALKFIPKEDLDRHGLGEFKALFEK